MSKVSAAVQAAIRNSVAQAGDEVVDLHLWTIGPGVYALILSVVSDHVKSPAQYRALLSADPHLAHITVEVWSREEAGAAN